ncbi:MAG: hypothetical protein IMF02_14470 [Proteobacteria bacterium]|nr:hypothetical protein [Pseudomonadota bacterium]
MIASPQKADLNDSSEIDQEGVQDGKTHIGMSKKGVRMAFGYPVPRRTPFLENSTWIYWRNRWEILVVEFGKDQRLNI